MATPAEKLAEALEILHQLQGQGFVAIKTSEISRVYRPRLVQNGFLKEVVRGWYIPARPDEKPGDTTSWYHSYWDFCARFLHERYANAWNVSAEQSILLHTGNWTVPNQLIIKSPHASNFNTTLLFNTSIFNLRSDLSPASLLTEEKGIRMLTLPAALVQCSPNTFTQNSVDARIALGMIRDSSEILPILLDGGHSVVAGRLAGAFRNIGRDRIADEIVSTMRAAAYDVREADPFATPSAIKVQSRIPSPYVHRIHLMWQQMREVIIQHFPKAPGIPDNHVAYLKSVEGIYVTDAYHSLSIEKYLVTPELIERVRSGQWDVNGNEEDKQQRDAMAARGYYLAFQKVIETVTKVLSGENPGKIADKEHSGWYLELFSPSVSAGLLKASDLAGYRNSPVYIRGSKHVPLNGDALRDAMPALFELLEQEPEASVRAVLGHFIFVFIHPYLDGNGRMGRFLMNVMLASGGYPWTVIPVEHRDAYMAALESASVEGDIGPFAKFVGYLVQKGMEGRPVASI